MFKSIDEIKRERLEELSRQMYEKHPFYKGDMRDFVLETIDLLNKRTEEVVEEEKNFCKQIYIDDVDWAEWGISDERAGERFEEYYTEERRYAKTLLSERRDK